MRSDTFDEIAVVVRYRNYDTDDPEHYVDLMKAFFDVAKADEEARRLNSVARPGVTYFVKIASLMRDIDI